MWVNIRLGIGRSFEPAARRAVTVHEHLWRITICKHRLTAENQLTELIKKFDEDEINCHRAASRESRWLGFTNNSKIFRKRNIMRELDRDSNLYWQISLTGNHIKTKSDLAQQNLKWKLLNDHYATTINSIQLFKFNFSWHFQLYF